MDICRGFKHCLAVFFVCLAGCQGGALYFEKGSSATVVVSENTTGAVWNASAKVAGQGFAPAIRYQVLGADAGLFTIDSTGALSFKQTADFEQPADADKNNEYQVDIQASVNTETATQTLLIKIADVTDLQLQVLQPQIYKNVGKGSEVSVGVLVRFYDAEAGAKSLLLQGGAKVSVNGIDLAADSSDPELWRGAVVVAGGKSQLQFLGQFSNHQDVTVAVPLVNKINGLDAAYLRLLPPNNLIVGGAAGIYRVNFSDRKLEFESGINLSADFVSGLDFNSGYNTLYLPDAGGGFSLRYFHSFVIDGLSLDGLPRDSQVVSLFSDAPNKRLIAVSKQKFGQEDYTLLSMPVEDGVRPTAPLTALWAIPNNVIQGTFKFCNLHGNSKTVIIADERLVEGKRATIIQGFTEAGQKRFEAVVGADISNLVVDEMRGAVYVAELHKSSFAKLKAINARSGEVSNLLDSFGNAGVGALTVLHMDNQNNQLYIGDDVSDSIFTLDFSARELRELSLDGFEFVDVTQVDMGQEN